MTCLRKTEVKLRIFSLIFYHFYGVKYFCFAKNRSKIDFLATKMDKNDSTGLLRGFSARARKSIIFQISENLAKTSEIYSCRIVFMIFI